MVLQRLLGTSVTSSSHQLAQKLRGIEPLRNSLHEAMHARTDISAQRMTHKINMARTPAELWLLRSDLHQCISQVHSHGVAAERINALIPAFEGRLPATKLRRI